MIPTFETKSELFKYLKDNEKEIISMKKAQLKCADSFATNSTNTNKALSTNYQDDESGVIKRTIIGNTYNWLDSHQDVHVKNTFKKSINENKNIFHLHDHKHEVAAKVGRFSNVYEKLVNWTDLGINKNGQTLVLMADSNISKELNSSVYNMYLKNEIDQHSVGMQYVKIDLAVNSDEEEYKANRETYDKYINEIGNKEEVEKQGYFWAVSEAKLIEISAVLMGSNVLTPTIENEPSKNTQAEPMKVTPSINWNDVLNNVKF